MLEAFASPLTWFQTIVIQQAAAFTTSHDVVVIGAGSGGSHAAGTLASAGLNVLLIEAGPKPPTFPSNIWRVGRFRAGNSRFWWTWRVKNSPFLFFAGKALGGTSAVNGMNYNQAHPEDYPVSEEDVTAALSSMGVPKLEKPIDLKHLPPALRTLVSAFESAEVPWIGVHGFSPSRTGIGFTMTWPQRRSAFEEALGLKRNTTSISSGYNKAAHSAGNVAILANTRVRRLIWSDAHPPSVQALEVVLHDNETATVPARHVVLAAGAIGSPSILLASGVPTRCNASSASSSVGDHLQEHWGFDARFSIEAPCLADRASTDIEGAWAVSLFQHYKAVLSVFLGGSHPTHHLVLTPYCCRLEDLGMRICFHMRLILLRGQSRGHVRSAVAEPGGLTSDKKAEVSFPIANDDLLSLLTTFIWFRKNVLGSYNMTNRLPEFLPIGRFPDISDPDGLFRYIGSQLRNYYHMSGTTSGAIDSRLRLQGCHGVRIADASAFRSFAGSPDIPVRALGQLVARYLLEDEPWFSSSARDASQP